MKNKLNRNRNSPFTKCEAMNQHIWRVGTFYLHRACLFVCASEDETSRSLIVIDRCPQKLLILSDKAFGDVFENKQNTHMHKHK